MLDPAPTTKIDPVLARGIVHALPEHDDAPIVLRYSNTSYQLHLAPTAPVTVPVGKRCVGRIHAQAQRVDVVDTGGRYIEPVYGEPRRLQGDIIDVDEAGNTITLNTGVPVTCSLTAPGQSAADFAVGQFVAFDVLSGVTFTPSA